MPKLRVNGKLETDLLLESIFRAYGYDFRGYEKSSMRRRISAFAAGEGLRSISSLQEKLLSDSECLDRLMLSLTINVTEMFRDPAFYRALREQVVPLYKHLPSVRIWHAGCSTGEEAYSTAITLKETGIYDKCRIYATDMNKEVLARARQGILPIALMKEYTENYIRAGGTAAFSQYYTAKFDHVILRRVLKQNIVFAYHNLVTDRQFNRFDLILLRNVLIFFNEDLKNQVLDLVDGSLNHSGILALGGSESLKLSRLEAHYEEILPGTRLYRKCG